MGCNKNNFIAGMSQGSLQVQSCHLARTLGEMRAIYCIFEPPHGTSRAMYALYLKVCTQRNVITEFYQENVSFILKTASISEPPFVGA